MSTPYIPTPTGYKAIYYHTEWSVYGRNFFVKDLPIDNLVDLSFAFVKVEQNGAVAIGDPFACFEKDFGPNAVDPSANDRGLFAEFKRLRAQGKKFNLSLAVGGWTYSQFFSDAFSTADNRTTFVTSLAKILTDNAIFNGICIDWEYLSDDGINYGNDGNTVRKEDGQNFILLLKQLRAALPNYPIAMCCSAATPEKVHWPVEDTVPLVDQLHVMTYDFHDGNWANETISAHHTNLYPVSYAKWSAKEAAMYYLSRGVPASKLLIGGVLYSRGFANTDGLGKPAQGGSPHTSWDTGCVDYKKLPWEGSIEMWDDEGHAPYAFSAAERVIDTYDNMRSVVEKAKFVKANGLAGIILWESSADFPYDNERSIMRALHDNLTHG